MTRTHAGQGPLRSAPNLPHVGDRPPALNVALAGMVSHTEQRRRVTDMTVEGNAIPTSADNPAPPTLRGIAWLLTICGAIGLIAAADLTIERARLLADPSYRPSCSLNPVLSCGSVMLQPQAQAFGFANSLLGIAGFAVVVTIGVGILARAQFARWFWIGLNIGALAGLVFVHWLMIQSLYVIGALCPYCMVVWVVTMTVFVAVTLSNIRTGVFSGKPSAEPGKSRVWLGVAIVAIWLAILAALIIIRFPTIFG